MSSQTPSAQRGMILVEQGRFPEAEKYFRESLAQEPNDAESLYYLALCELNQNRAKEALATIDRALSLDPEGAVFHAFRAIVLADMEKTTEALASAREAIRIDPDSDYAYVAAASASLSKKDWVRAEEYARKALDLNPENGSAANQLAHALRLQNRIQESSEQAAYMLSQDPEDADTHCTAGWVALQRGNVKEAEGHFLEALRLDATHEAAREGLKESFKARSPIYRAYLNYCFFMQRFTAGKQWLVIIGLLVGVRVANRLLPPVLAAVVTFLYLLLVLWVHVARGVGNFQVLLDRSARYALSFGERLEACFVGGGVLLGLLLIPCAFLLGNWAFAIGGFTLIGAAFPLAYTFTNASRGGRLLFGAIALYVYGIGAANILQHLQKGIFGDWLTMGTSVAIGAVILTTWICSVPSLNRRR